MRRQKEATPLSQSVDLNWPQTNGFYLTLLACLTAILFWKVFVHPAQMLWASDIIRAHAEYKQVQWNSFWRWGAFPLWDPTVYCGKSIVGDPLTGLLYIPAWIFWLIPSPSLFGFFMWFQVTLGAWGMFLFARQKGCDVTGGLFAAIAFAFAGKTASHLFAGHVELLSTMLGLPWILWAVDRVLAEPTWRKAVVAGLIAAVVATCGSVQIMYWHFLFVLAYAFFYTVSASADKPVKAMLRPWMFLVLAGVIFAAVAAPWWFPVVRQTLLLGARARGTDLAFATMDSATYGDLLRLIWPFFNTPLPHPFASDAALGFSWETASYPGIITLCFALAAPFCLKSVKGVTSLSVLGILAILFALGESSPLHWAACKIVPGFGLFRCPGRMLFYANFGFAILGGLMLTHAASVKSKWWLPLVTCLLCQGVLIGSVFVRANAEEPVVNLWLPLAILVTLAPLTFLWTFNHIPERLWRPGVLAVLFIELAVVWNSNVHVIETRQAMPKLAAAEFLAKEHETKLFRIYDPTNTIEQQAAAQYGLELITGYHPGVYARHLDLYKKIWKSDQSTFTEQYMHSPNDIACSNIFNLMNAEYVIAFEDNLGDEYEHIYQTPEFESDKIRHVFRRKDALPRAFMVARAETPADGKPLLDALCNINPKEACLVEDTPFEGKAEYQPLTIQRNAPGDMTITVSNTEPGIAVISEAWHPDWRATDHGQPIILQRVNYNFLGIPLQAGEHQLHVYYCPWDFYAGLGIAALAGIAILVASAIQRSTPIKSSSSDSYGHAQS